MNKLLTLLFFIHLFMFSCTTKKNDNPIIKLKKGLWLPVNPTLVPFRYSDRPDTVRYDIPPSLVLNSCPSTILSRDIYTDEHKIYQDESGKWKFNYHHSFNDWDCSISSNLDTLTFLFSNYEKGARYINYTYACSNTASGISTMNELEAFLKNTNWIEETSDTSERIIGFFKSKGTEKDEDPMECSYTEHFSIPVIHYIEKKATKAKTRYSYSSMYFNINNDLFFVIPDLYDLTTPLEGVFVIKHIDELNGIITLTSINPFLPYFNQDIVWRKRKEVNTYLDSIRMRYNNITLEQSKNK